MYPAVAIPLLMGCALLWWVGKDMTWPTRLTVFAITLAVVVGILLFEHASR